MLVGATLVAVVLASSASANLLANGDWSTGDETGWTRIPSSWGINMSWSVTWNGPTPPEGTLAADGGSYGWYQTVPVDPGTPCTVTADWAGHTISWAEVMLWSVPAGTSAADIEATFDAGPTSAIAYKKDAWGMNPPTTWPWEAAALSPHPSGNGGTVISQGVVVVGLKLGASGTPGDASFDNVVLTPEPSTALLLGLSLMLLRRRP